MIEVKANYDASPMICTHGRQRGALVEQMQKTSFVY
jgi:hypothetical protein